MDSYIAGSLIGASGNIGSTLINQAFAEHNRRRNYYWNEKAAKAADKRQRAQYMDLYSPNAQMQQLKEAGLSPSLMYGNGGGAGGGTASSNMSMGASGPQAPYMSAMESAQIANLLADTQLKKSQAENTEKDTELKGQKIINLVSEVGLTKAQTRLTTAQADLADINVAIDSTTMQADIERAYHNTAKAAAEARSAVVKADLDEATFDAAYQLAYANLDETLTRNELLGEQADLVKQQVREIASNISLNQWKAWKTEKEQYRKDAIFQLDKAKLEAEVKMFYHEQNIELTKAKLDMISDLVGYVCNFATCGLSNVTKLKQTEMYTNAINKPKTSVTKTDKYDKNHDYQGQTITYKKTD